VKLTATAIYSNVLWIRKTILIFGPQLTHTAARSLCDSWATCLSEPVTSVVAMEVAIISVTCSFSTWKKNSTIADMAGRSCTVRIFAVECGVPVFNALFLSNLWLPKTTSFGYIFVVYTMDLTLTIQPQWRNCPLIILCSDYGKITQDNGHYAVQAHSRSPISIPMESPYATSYVSVIVMYRFRDMDGGLLVQFSPSTGDFSL